MSGSVSATGGAREIPDDAGLELRNVGVAFGARDGLHGVNLSVHAGERIALLGPSGVGKTTLLRAIAGLEPVTEGVVCVAGRDVTHAPPERRGAVYLHQTPMLFPHLSVEDNVGFPLEVRGLRRRDARARAREFLDRVQLSNLAHRAAGALSGGQRHRVALARALAAEPAVLLLDEPFNALDPALRSDVRDAVFSMLAVDDGPAVVIVTHDIDEAAALSARMVLLLEGRIVQDAAPSRMLARPASVEVARFLGLPNIVNGVVADGVFRCALGSFAARVRDGSSALVARADAFVAHRATPPATQPPKNAAHGSVRATVLELRERVSGALVLVSVDRPADAPREETEPVRVLARRGAPSLDVGDPVVLSIDAEHVHIVSRAVGGAAGV